METRKPPEAARAAQRRNPDEIVVVAKIAATHGLEGWLKLDSGSPEVLAGTGDWLVRRPGGEWRPLAPSSMRDAGGRIQARFPGFENLDDARELIGSQIGIRRSDLPELPDGEEYWCDLVGLRVTGADGGVLGVVAGVTSTRAHDILEVSSEQGRILVPFVAKHIVDIDRESGTVRTNWLAEY